MTTVGLPHLYSGKVRDIYDAGDGRLLMVTSDRHLGLRRRDGRADPRQGPRAHRDVGLLVRAARRRRPQPPDLDRPRRSARDAPGGPSSPGGSCSCRQAEMLPDRVHRARLPHRARRGRSTRRRGTMHGLPLPAGLQESRQAARAGVHAVDQGRAGRPRREHLLRARPSTSSARTWPTRARDVVARAVPAGRRAGPPSAASSSPTPSSSSGSSTASWSLVRRGAHAGLVPLLAGRRVGAGHDAADLRQAAGARLPRALDWDKTPAAAAAARRGRRRHRRRATSRPTSGSPAGRFADWPGGL